MSELRNPSNAESPNPLALIHQLTHEARNALQRSQAALDRLRWRCAAQSDCLELVARVQAAHEEFLRLCEVTQSLADPLRVNRSAQDVGDFWREVMQDLAQSKLPVIADGTPAQARCELDRPRLKQVFRHAVSYLRSENPEAPAPTVALDLVDQNGRALVQWTFRRDGPALSPEERRRFGTLAADGRPRKHQLYLALAQKIVAAHDGQFFLADGPGVKLVLQLPRSSP